MTKFEYEVVSKYGISIDTPGVFKPTGTTWELLNAVSEIVEPEMRVLDLGCGCGLLGLELLERNEGHLNMFMSDVSPKAARATETNAILTPYNTKVSVKTGSLLEPWADLQFDLIINDISAVVPEIGLHYGWFQSAPNESGDDGSQLAVNIIDSAADFLTSEKSVLAMPLISLSNTSRQISHLEKNFRNVVFRKSRTWPLGTMDDNLLSLINKYPFTTIGKLGGIATFTTQIVFASDPVL